MNIEEIFRYVIKYFFENYTTRKIDPLDLLIEIYLGAISNDYNDDIIFDDMPTFDQAIDEIYDSMDGDLNHNNPYEEAMEWLGGDNAIDFEYKVNKKYKRILVKTNDKGLPQLLDYCGIKYKKADLDNEYDEAVDKAEEEYKDNYEYDKDPYAYYGVSRKDFV
jgi:hypothetical protein